MSSSGYLKSNKISLKTDIKLYTRLYTTYTILQMKQR